MALGWVGKLFALTILATLMLQAGLQRGLALFLGLLGVAIIAGAAAGTIHGLLRPLERWGAFGTWLSWVLTIVGYVCMCVLLTPAGPFTLREPTFYPIAAAFAALGAAGLVLLDDRRPGRPSPRQFRLLQSRDRLWAAAARARARIDPPTSSRRWTRE